MTRHVLRDDVVLLQLKGHLDVVAATCLRRELLKFLAVPPVVVICDLADVSGLEHACATVFPAVVREVGGWPSVTVALCGARPAVAEQLRREALPHFIAVFPDLDAAAGAVATRPPYLSTDVSLLSDDRAAAESRRFAERVCDTWHIGESTDVVLLVLTEMVTNAVRHGRPPIRASLRLRRGRLNIAVTDHSVVRPHPSLAARPIVDVAASTFAEGGRGLRVIAALSEAWGVSSAEDDVGKTIWCEIRVRRDGSTRTQARPN